MTRPWGSLRIGEQVFPVTGLGLLDGKVVVYAAGQGPTPAYGPDTMVMVYGQDGGLVVRGEFGGHLPPCHAGDGLNITFDLHVIGKVTEGVRHQVGAS